MAAAVNQQPPLWAAVVGPHGLTPNNTKPHHRARSERSRGQRSRAPLGAAPSLMCDWHGRRSPWQRECWPWRVPGEQLVGSGRLVSKQIYRQWRTTRPPSRGGNHKAAISVEDNKEGIVGQRPESDSQGPFPGGSARSRRGRQDRVGEAPPLLKSFKWGRFDAICQIQFERNNCFDSGGSRRDAEGGIPRAGRSFEAGRGLKMSFKLSRK